MVFELGLEGSKDFNRQKARQEGLSEQSTITDVNRQFGWSTGTYSVVIIERHGNWIGKHMDKRSPFAIPVLTLAHETVSSWTPEISTHCTTHLMCDYLLPMVQ